MKAWNKLHDHFMPMVSRIVSYLATKTPGLQMIQEKISTHSQWLSRRKSSSIAPGFHGISWPNLHMFPIPFFLNWAVETTYVCFHMCALQCVLSCVCSHGALMMLCPCLQQLFGVSCRDNFSIEQRKQDPSLIRSYCLVYRDPSIDSIGLWSNPQDSG